jgi:hypothetical protein
MDAADRSSNISHDAWINLAELPGLIAQHHPALTKKQITSAEDWLKDRAPTGFRLGSPIPLAWRSRPMTAEAGKYLDIRWADRAAIIRIKNPEPGSALAQLRAQLAEMGYTDRMWPEGPAAVACALGVSPPPGQDIWDMADDLLKLDGQWAAMELPVSLVEAASTAAPGEQPAHLDLNKMETAEPGDTATAAPGATSAPRGPQEAEEPLQDLVKRLKAKRPMQDLVKRLRQEDGLVRRTEFLKAVRTVLPGCGSREAVRLYNHYIKGAKLGAPRNQPSFLQKPKLALGQGILADWTSAWKHPPK